MTSISLKSEEIQHLIGMGGDLSDLDWNFRINWFQNASNFEQEVTYADSQVLDDTKSLMIFLREILISIC